MTPLSWDSIDPATGLPYTWDHPNLRWGDPSYVLEPGDYGYYSPTTKHTKHTMKHQPFYPVRVGDQIIWLGNFRQKINTYAATVDITPQEVLDIIADCRWLIYIYSKLLATHRTNGEALTAFAEQAKYGTGPLMVIPPLGPPAFDPAEPTNTPPLPAVVPRTEGALTRILALCERINNHPACTPTMCEDLGIVGTVAAGPDYETFAPVLKIKRSGGQVLIDWGWQGYSKFLDAIEILVDRGNGFVPLVTDTTPDYTDSFTQPATQAIWKYKAIYRVDDERVGQWSQEVSVVVGG